MRFRKGTCAMLSLFAAVALIVGGCAKQEDKGGQAKGTEAPAKEKGTPVAEKKAEAGHDWWCDEHGIPEAECSMCSKKVADECKKKGDWCKEHERAKSQCFICDPSLKEKYAAKYSAKYGKEPPPPEDNMKKDETKKDDKK